MTRASGTTDLTTFRDHAAEHLDRLEASGGVEVLTIDGQPKGVVMAPHVYDRMADQIEQAEITAGLRRGLGDVAAGRVVPARQVMDQLAAELKLHLEHHPE